MNRLREENCRKEEIERGEKNKSRNSEIKEIGQEEGKSKAAKSRKKEEENRREK